MKIGTGKAANMLQITLHSDGYRETVWGLETNEKGIHEFCARHNGVYNPQASYGLFVFFISSPPLSSLLHSILPSPVLFHVS